MTDRQHFVFLTDCGCPFGLTEMRSRVKTVDDAWDDMYDTRQEERAARAAGVHVELVDHATYVAKFYDRMAKRCPHGAA